jgi:hypothetical protein
MSYRSNNNMRRHLPYLRKNRGDQNVGGIQLPVVVPTAKSLVTMVFLAICLINTFQMAQYELSKTSVGQKALSFCWRFGAEPKATPNRTPYFTKPFRRFKPIAARKGLDLTLVNPGDFIYYKNLKYGWDASPVVIPQFKLLFFTIPKNSCTGWKQLFRRIMGHADWMLKDDIETFMPHNPQVNGLKYLYDYSTEEASRMMTDPNWTRAIFVREPKQRFLSSFLDKSVSNAHQHIIDRCFPDLIGPNRTQHSSVVNAQTLPGFLDLVNTCDDGHWMPQHTRMERKFWPYVDFVGHVETSSKDAKRLLQRIGAWDEYGARGWGKNGNFSFLESSDADAAGLHAHYSQWQAWTWYTPVVEEMVEQHYTMDYENPLFNFTRGLCLTCID